jgi:hypothetical protein
MAKINLKKPVQDVLLSMERDYPEIKELIRGFDYYNSIGYFKSKVPKIYLKMELKSLKNARISCRKKYDPPSDSRAYWVGMALARVIEVLFKYISDSNITLWTKFRLGSVLGTTATLVSRAMKRFSWGDKAVKLIRAELKAIIKQKRTEKREKTLIALFEKNFAK